MSSREKEQKLFNKKVNFYFYGKRRESISEFVESFSDVMILWGEKFKAVKVPAVGQEFALIRKQTNNNPPPMKNFISLKIENLDLTKTKKFPDCS